MSSKNIWYKNQEITGIYRLHCFLILCKLKNTKDVFAIFILSQYQKNVKRKNKKEEV